VNLLVLVDIAAIHSLELKIAGDSGLQEKLHHETSAHKELRDKINVVVTRISQSCGGLLAGEELLEKLIQIQRSTISSIIVVSIHVEHLLSLNTQDSGDDTLLQTGSKNNAIVFFIHV